MNEIVSLQFTNRSAGGEIIFGSWLLLLQQLIIYMADGERCTMPRRRVPFTVTGLSQRFRCGIRMDNGGKWATQFGNMRATGPCS